MKEDKKLKIHKERCKGCELCIGVCPKHILYISEEVNKKGTHFVVIKSPEKCTKCGLCVMMCPDCAIEIKGIE